MFHSTWKNKKFTTNLILLERGEGRRENERMEGRSERGTMETKGVERERESYKIDKNKFT